MDALAEVNADAKEVDEAVRIGGDVAIGVEDARDEDLEEELRTLVEEVEREKADANNEQESAATKARLEEPGVQVPSEVAEVEEAKVQVGVLAS